MTRGAASRVPGLDWRALLIAIIAGLSTFSPSATLAGGVVVCLGVLVMSLPGGVRFGAADAWAAGLTVLAVTSTSWAVSPEVTVISALTQFKLLVIFVTIRVVIVSRRSLTVIAVGYWIGCLYALLLVSRQNRDLSLTVRLSIQRHGIEGVNLNYLAYALATGAAVLVLLWYATTLRGLPRLALMATALPIYFGIVLSWYPRCVPRRDRGVAVDRRAQILPAHRTACLLRGDRRIRCRDRHRSGGPAVGRAGQRLVAAGRRPGQTAADLAGGSAGVLREPADRRRGQRLRLDQSGRGRQPQHHPRDRHRHGHRRRRRVPVPDVHRDRVGQHRRWTPDDGRRWSAPTWRP